MIDLETRLRSSLHERADDVEPTPELWRSIERRVARRRALPLFLWVAAGTAAAITAVAVLPGILDRSDSALTIDPADAPTRVEPTAPAEDGTLGTGLPSHYVAVSGQQLVLRASDGTSETTLLELALEGESQIETLAVRPGSSPTELTVAYVTSGEGMYDLRLLRADAGGTFSTTVVANLTAGLSPLEAVAPTLAWSPDGRTLAWAAPSSVGTPTLNVVEIPDEITREARFSDIEEAPLTGTDAPLDAARLRLQDWRVADGRQQLSFTEDGRLLRTELARDADGFFVGRLAPDTSVTSAVVDVAADQDGEEIVLTASGTGSQDAEEAGLEVRISGVAAGVDLPTAAPFDVWMTAVPGAAIVGLGDEASMVHRELDGPVVAIRTKELPPTRYAAFVPVSGTGASPDSGGTPGTDRPRASGPLSDAGVAPYLAIDGEGRIVLVEGDGGAVTVLFDGPASEPGANPGPIDLAVRPGSTVDDLTAVVLVATEGGPGLRELRVVNGEVSFTPFPDRLGIGPDADYGALQVPVWSPDGRHLAWAERGGDGHWTVRTIGWDGGPGTGRRADDNAGFGIDLVADDLVVADWVWASQGPEGTAAGALLLVRDRGVNRYLYPALQRLPIERQADGGLAVTGPLEYVDEAGLRVVDMGVHDGIATRLVLESGTYVVLLASPSDDRIGLPFPEGTQPRDLDLDALEHVVVVSDRGSGLAFVVDRDGELAPLEADAATPRAFDPVD